jgi:fructokinase
MNVAYHLKKLGVNPALITRIGLDDEGRRLIRIMEASGVSTDFFQTDPALPTGIVDATVGAGGDVVYDIKKPVAWDHIGWEDRLEELISKTGFFVFGSLAARDANSYRTLVRARALAKRKVLDINLRAPHYNRTVIEELLEDLFLLKLNHDELALIAGWLGRFETDRERIQALQDKYRLSRIVVTRGSRGAILQYNGVYYEHPGFTVRLQDTIGSGDAFLAGLIAQLGRGTAPPDALAFSCAIGSLIASYRGPCPDYAVGEIDALSNKP